MNHNNIKESTMKRFSILTLVLFVLICSVVLPLTACSNDGDNDNNSEGPQYNYTKVGVEYTLTEDGTAYIASGINSQIKSANLILPPTHNDKPVIGIAPYAFGANYWVNVRIPSTMIYIGESAFGDSYNLATITFEQNSQLTTIGKNAFGRSSNLQLLELPASLTHVGEKAFIITSTRTSICYYGTQEQWNAINFAGTNPFSASSITYDYVPSTDYTKDVRLTLFSDTQISYVTGCYGFSNHLVVPEIHYDIPVTIVESYAFSHDYNIISITLPDSLTTIQEYAFRYCYGLEELIVGKDSNLKTIEDNAFNHCISLHTIILPDTLEYISPGAFNYCSELTTILFRGTEKEWNAIAPNGIGYKCNPTTIVFNYNGK